MEAKFDDVALYDGHGRGVLTIDGSSGTANIGANFNLSSVSALPFLRDAANFGWVSGNANVALKLAANGASQLQLIESLNGTAGFQFSDGAVVGFNLPGALRGLSQGNFGALKTSPSEKTDFSALAATFTVTNGVAQNQDLQLVSPLLRVTGGGTIHMPERTVDYTVKPKLIASLEGQGGEAEASGIEVPVHITGSWDHPSYRPDLKGVLSDPNKTMDAIKQIGKKLKGKNADEIVDQLFGKKERSVDRKDQEEREEPAEQIIRQARRPKLADFLRLSFASMTVSHCVSEALQNLQLSRWSVTGKKNSRRGQKNLAWGGHWPHMHPLSSVHLPTWSRFSKTNEVRSGRVKPICWLGRVTWPLMTPSSNWGWT